MNENPVCSYKYFCIFQRDKKCMILNSMPKPRKDNTCHFAKRHPSDIAGKAPFSKKDKKGAENDQKKTDSIWHHPDPAELGAEDHKDQSGEKT